MSNPIARKEPPHQVAVIFDEDAESHDIAVRLLLLGGESESGQSTKVLLYPSSNVINQIGPTEDCTTLGPLADCFMRDVVSLRLLLLRGSEQESALRTMQTLAVSCSYVGDTAMGSEYSIDLHAPVDPDVFFVHVFRRNNGSIAGHLHRAANDHVAAGVAFSQLVMCIEVFISDEAVPQEKRHFHLVLVNSFLISVELTKPASEVVDGAAVLRQHGHSSSRMFIFRKAYAKVTWDETFVPVSDNTDVDVSIVVGSDEEEMISISTDHSRCSRDISIVVENEEQDESLGDVEVVPDALDSPTGSSSVSILLHPDPHKLEDMVSLSTGSSYSRYSRDVSVIVGNEEHDESIGDVEVVPDAPDSPTGSTHSVPMILHPDPHKLEADNSASLSIAAIENESVADRDDGSCFTSGDESMASRASNALPSVVRVLDHSSSNVIFTPSMLINGIDGSEFDVSIAPGLEGSVVGMVPEEEGGGLEAEEDTIADVIEDAVSEAVEVSVVEVAVEETVDDEVIYEDTDDVAHDIDEIHSIHDNASVSNSRAGKETVRVVPASAPAMRNDPPPSIMRGPPLDKLNVYIAHKNRPPRVSTTPSRKHSEPRRKRPSTATPIRRPVEEEGKAESETAVQRMPMSATQLRRAPKPLAKPEPELIPKRPRVPKQVPQARSSPKAVKASKETDTIYSVFVAACGGRGGDTGGGKDYTRCLSPITRSILERTTRPTWEPDAPEGGSRILIHRPDTSPDRHNDMVLTSKDYAGWRSGRRTKSATTRRAPEVERSAAQYLMAPSSTTTRVTSAASNKATVLHRSASANMSAEKYNVGMINSNLLTIAQAGAGVSTPYVYHKTLVTNTLPRPSSAANMQKSHVNNSIKNSISKKLRLLPCPVNAIWYRQVYEPAAGAADVGGSDRQRPASSTRDGLPLTGNRTSSARRRPAAHIWKSMLISVGGVAKLCNSDPQEVNSSRVKTQCNCVAGDLMIGACVDVFHGHYDVGLSVLLDYAQLVDMNGPDSEDRGVIRKTWLIAHGAGRGGEELASGLHGGRQPENEQQQKGLLEFSTEETNLAPKNLDAEFQSSEPEGSKVASLVTHAEVSNVFGETCTHTVTLAALPGSKQVDERAHVRTGDEVVSIDGWDISRMNAEQIRELVNITNEDAQSVCLLVRRYVRVEVESSPTNDTAVQPFEPIGPNSAQLLASSLLLINRNVLPFDDITLTRAEIIKKKQDKEKAERLGKMPILHKLITPDELSKAKPVMKIDSSPKQMLRSKSAKGRSDLKQVNTSTASPHGSIEHQDHAGNNAMRRSEGFAQALISDSKRRDRLIDFALSRNLIRPNSALPRLPSQLSGDVSPEGSAFFGSTPGLFAHTQPMPGRSSAKAGRRHAAPPGDRGWRRKGRQRQLDEEASLRLGAFVPATRLSPSPMPSGHMQVEKVLHNMLEEKWTRAFGSEQEGPQTSSHPANNSFNEGPESDKPGVVLMNLNYTDKANSQQGNGTGAAGKNNNGRVLEILVPKTRGALMIIFSVQARRGQNRIKRLLVESLEAGSRVLAQGLIRLGDEIREVNGLPVAGKYYEEVLRDISRDKDDHVLLTVYRPGLDAEECQAIEKQGASFVVKTRELVSQHSWDRLFHDV